jgi:hypothetical protein
MTYIRILMILSLLTSAMLAGCFGDSPPDESDARAVFENQLGKEFKDGIVRINTFKKLMAYPEKSQACRFIHLNMNRKLNIQRA